ncbi:XRE family transcriptional regulator [Bacillus infantis]|uniref:helix-turn-helix transcriptional regulator n=1 Tax=Bacillus infantis TaxID=324767 RepID=UPI00101CEC47|nr:helix-turn-helix transcriptional regulator [Bacillus infantis]RYI25179.1 XRE family transcriptional regulator [Bacillus infantis]
MHALEYFIKLRKTSNKEIGEILNCSSTQVNDWKTGRRKIPEKHISRLCHLFDIPIDKAEILERSNIEELDRAEIELIQNEVILHNALQEGDYMPEVIHTFEQRVELSKGQFEILSLVHELKGSIQRATLMDIHFNKEKFQDELDKVRELITYFNTK